MMNRFLLIASIFLSACAPLRTVPQDEKHQWELKVHELGARQEDLRHDINAFQTQLQILDSRIKYHENALSTLKQKDLEYQQKKLSEIASELKGLKDKWEKTHQGGEKSQELYQKLSFHANETTQALTQFRARLQELEEMLITQTRRFDEVAKIKKGVEELAKNFKVSYKTYRVRPGDSLEKIATLHKTKVDHIKALNALEKDLIVVGQELKIPTD